MDAKPLNPGLVQRIGRYLLVEEVIDPCPLHAYTEEFSSGYDETPSTMLQE